MNYQLQNSPYKSKRIAWISSAFLLCSGLVAAQSQQPPPILTPQQEARSELNAAARAYREGKFAEAQRHSERASELDPENSSAPMFVARSIHAQFKPGDFTTENVGRAQEAIAAYQRILSKNRFDDEAYKAIASIYGNLKEDELLSNWILQRAADTSFDNDRRSEAYVVLTSKYWDCSYKFTELPTHKIVTVDVQRKRSFTRYRKGNDEGEFGNARDCASRGLEMAELAIALKPDSVSAWSYKTNVLLELAKFAEMSGDVQQKIELQGQYDAALKETTRLSEEEREQKEKAKP
jgi:tetratricopeptide (TPR) repeat protein